MPTAGSDGRVEEQLRAELQETQKQLREELEETRKQLRVELGETQSQLSASQVTQQEHRNAVQSLRYPGSTRTHARTRARTHSLNYLP